jgi:rod shape determining protein RodA
MNIRKISLDWWIVGALIPLLFGGLATMTSFVSEQAFFQKQLLWVGISVAVGYGVSRIDMRFLRQPRFLVVLFAISAALLGSVLLFGKTIKGAQSWIDFGGFSFQPTDIAKLVLILILAKYFSRRHIHIEQLRHLFISFAYAGVLIALVLLQPDFGSAMVFGFLWLGMAIIAGISKKHLLILGVAGLAIGTVAWMFFFQDYQKKRIISFVQPMSDVRGSGYNAYQSMIAVGSGGLLGKGVGYGTQSRLNFLPEYQTDFIFAAFSEEWGFFGTLIILAAFMILLWRLVWHSVHGASNFERLFCAGYAIMLFSHILINVGMNIGVMPITGIPLPFMSYGGSHLLGEMIGLGIVFSMARYARPAHQDDLRKEFVGYA